MVDHDGAREVDARRQLLRPGCVEHDQGPGGPLLRFGQGYAERTCHLLRHPVRPPRGPYGHVWEATLDRECARERVGVGVAMEERDEAAPLELGCDAGQHGM